MNLAQVAELVGAATNRRPSELLFDISGFSIDSRTLREGDLFFALKGEHTDGHQFVERVFAQGACGAVVSREWVAPDSMARSALLRVDDILLALQELAASVLRRWGNPIVGITGSSGKTTTKELTAAVLSERFQVHRSAMNLNNLFGLPLSVLDMVSRGKSPEQFNLAVLEMGMSTSNEIQRLCEIAPPQVGVVTNVSAAHLEFFPSVDAIADAKAALIDSLGAGGIAILNGDDERVARMRGRHEGRTITFGIENAAEVMASELEVRGAGMMTFTLSSHGGRVRVALPLPGVYNVQNALAAAGAGRAFGLSLAEIARGLENARAAEKRGEVLRFREGFAMIDESYNSNPRALSMVMQMLGSLTEARRKILVAGEMLELGPASEALHAECGTEAAGLGIDAVIGVRGHARALVDAARKSGMSHGRASYCESPEEAADLLKRIVRPGDVVVVKGSRGVRTDIVVAAIKRDFELESEHTLKEQRA